MAEKGKSTSQCIQLRTDVLPGLPMGYSLPSAKDGPLATILVMRDTSTNMMMSIVVPLTGARMEFPVRRSLTFIRELGLEKGTLVLMPDHESAILHLINGIAKRKPPTSKVGPFGTYIFLGASGSGKPAIHSGGLARVFSWWKLAIS